MYSLVCRVPGSQEDCWFVGFDVGEVDSVPANVSTNDTVCVFTRNFHSGCVLVCMWPHTVKHYCGSIYVGTQSRTCTLASFPGAPLSIVIHAVMYT